MKLAKQQEARRLRAEGCSIKEISRRLNVAKSSVSYWVRGISLTPQQLKHLEEREAANRARFSFLSRLGEVNQQKSRAEQRHKLFLETGFHRAQSDVSFRVICALYWGEGQKKAKLFGICNSDPSLLNVALTWLIREGYDEVIRFRVRYYPENGLTEEDIRRWWFQHLPGLKEHHLRAFGKCSIHRASQRKKIGKLPYGTATLEVYRTELHYNILGGIDYLRTMGDW